MTKKECILSSLKTIKRQISSIETDIESLRYESVNRLDDAIVSAADDCGYALENITDLITTLEDLDEKDFNS